MSRSANAGTPSKSQGVLSQASSILVNRPTISLLFFALAALESLILTALFLSHSGTFYKFLGPIIRRLWGERFLHYPDNFLLLPKIYNYEHIFILSTLGLLITGIVIKKIETYSAAENQASTLSSAGLAFRKYFSFLLVWIPLYLLIRSSARFILPFLSSNPILQIVGLALLLLFFQCLTAFIFPSIIISGKGFIRAVVDGIGLALKNIHKLAVLLFIPVFLSVAMSYAKAMAPQWITGEPDFVLYLLYAGIFVAYAVDAFVTVVATLLYLKVRT